MVLGDDFDGEVVFEDVDVGVCAHGLDKAFLNFEARVVGVVEDAEFAVTAFAVEVEGAVGLAVEVDAPFDEPADLLGSTFDDFLDGGGVAEHVAGDHRVADVFVEVIHFKISHGGDASLREGRVSLFELGFAHESDAAAAGHFEGKAHAGDAGAYDEIVVFAFHSDDWGGCPPAGACAASVGGRRGEGR